MQSDANVFPLRPSSKNHRLYRLAKTQFDRYDAAGKLTAKQMIIMLLLNPTRLACAGGRINIDELEARLHEADAQLQAMGFSAAEISVGKQLLMASLPAYNAADVECTVCLDIMSSAMQTPCNHLFCNECIIGVIQTQGKCPICRTRLRAEELRKPFVDPIAAVVAMDTNGSATAAAAAASGEHLFDAKINALMTELHQMRASSPSAKALVFSQFNASLGLLKQRLTEEGLSWHTISADMNADRRGTMLKAFNAAAAGTILLLTARTGAVGLTLTGTSSEIFQKKPEVQDSVGHA
jgi:SNF2 family DNA or RNA helicase